MIVGLLFDYCVTQSLGAVGICTSMKLLEKKMLLKTLRFLMCHETKYDIMIGVIS